MPHLAQDALTNLLDRGEVFPALIVFAAMGVGLIIVLMAILAGILKTRAREETKREISAYVAEGSIDPDTALALIRAGSDSEACSSAIKAAIGGAPKGAVVGVATL